MQTNWSQQINPLIVQPLNQGQLLQDIALNIGTTQVNHKLGRTLLGWFLTRLPGKAIIYDSQDSNPNPTLNLQLVSDTKITVDIFVF